MAYNPLTAPYYCDTISEDSQKEVPVTLALLWLLHCLYGKKGFVWRTESYEFVKDVSAIDLLTGSMAFRERITTRDFQEIAPLALTRPSFEEERGPYLLYQ